MERGERALRGGAPADCAEHVVAAIAEGRNREVAICSIDLNMPYQILISNMVDSRTFVETKTILQSCQPAVILMADTGFQRVSNEIRKHFKNPKCRLIAIAQKDYDQIFGSEDLKRVAANSIDRNFLKSPLITGATACLLKYVEYNQGVNMALARPVLLMDFATIESLELTREALTGLSHCSLAAMIDATHTNVGRKLLRQSIVRPSCDLNVINSRHQFINLFLKNQSIYEDIIEILPQFANFDKMMAQLVLVQNIATATASQQSVVNLIAIKNTLELLPQLCECLLFALARSTQPNDILNSIINSLQKDVFKTILDSIDGVIDEKSQWNRSAKYMNIEGSLAVKTEINPKLDTTREAYLKTINLIQSKVDEYRDNVGRGYHVIIQNCTTSQAPKIFTQCVAAKKNVACTTKELISLNSRATDYRNKIYELSYHAIQSVLNKIRPFAKDFHEAIDNIALLDMLLSFTGLIANAPANQPYCCPVINSSCSLLIEKGRHPLVEQIMTDRPFAPNDVCLDPLQNLNSSFLAKNSKYSHYHVVITGPNSSGKTTYLKMTAIITILAHMGCYVPATKAVIPLCKRIFTRLGTSDRMEDNESTFTVEMCEIAYILDNLTDQSLILIDELGRGTSNKEGFALAWAACEHLLNTQALTLFATHFHDLKSLTRLYSNCFTSHFSTTKTKSNLIQTEYKLAAGPCPQIEGYGIQAAEVCGMPTQIITDAKRLLAKSQFGGRGINEFDGIENAMSSNVKRLVQALMKTCHVKTSQEDLKHLLQQLGAALAAN